MRYALPFLALAFLAGCQSYKPAPLDFEKHQLNWSTRDPASPAVVEYARQLSAASAANTVAFNPADGLSLPEAEAVALFFNSRLRVARLKAKASTVSAADAGRWEDPVLRVDAERIIQSVEHPWVIGGLLELTLPLSGRLPLEREKATAEAAVATARAVIEEQEVLNELTAAWTELALTDRRLELTANFLTDLDEITAQSVRLQQAGELGPLETGLFRMEQSRRRAALQRLSAQREDQAIAIRTLLGLVPEAPIKLVPSLPALDGDAATLSTSITPNQPRLRLLREEYTVAEKAMELEVRKQWPDLTIGGGYGRDEGTNRVLGGLGIPIPIFNANRRSIAEARANRDSAAAAANAEYESLISQLARARLALKSAIESRQMLERELAPMADEQVNTARRLSKLGNVNSIALFETLTAAHEARLEVLEVAGRQATSVNQIKSLLRPATGVELPSKEKQ